MGHGKGSYVELDRELLERARAALGGTAIKDTVNEGLRRIVAESALNDLADYVGGLDDEQREALNAARSTAW